MTYYERCRQLAEGCGSTFSVCREGEDWFAHWRHKASDVEWGNCVRGPTRESACQSLWRTLRSNMPEGHVEAVGLAASLLLWGDCYLGW